MASKKFLALAIVLGAFLSMGTAQNQDSGLRKEVAVKVEEVNTLRETLVQSVPKNVTPGAFKAACGPVGKKAKSIAQSKGWKFRQVSHKNRNPKNAARANELKAIQRFQNNPQELSYFEESPMGLHYYRRITIIPKCLSCHGAKASRPGFIVKKYPKDKAFDFKVGDLRGIYSVFVPKNSPQKKR